MPRPDTRNVMHKLCQFYEGTQLMPKIRPCLNRKIRLNSMKKAGNVPAYLFELD